ncbi:hypothetical protein ACQRC6_09050 [Peptoniphilus sp. SGI.035]|uniref:hypothetical protein n=1 Tax=Peptoniphilus sp. SGI.035 TaxID=3420564 RepID=UPI003D0878FE
MLCEKFIVDNSLVLKDEKLLSHEEIFNLMLKDGFTKKDIRNFWEKSKGKI